jgi:hypothetical protein
MLLTAGVGATTYAKVDASSKLRSAAASGATTTAAATAGAKPKAATASTPKASASASTSAAASASKAAAAAAPSPKATSTTQLEASISSMSVSKPLEGEQFSGEPQVGTLFGTSNGSLTSHHCTGSVVSSPEGDIVVTAAHCVYDGGADTALAFVPEYDNGSMPYGAWDVSAVYVAPQWTANRDPDYDVAFIVVHQSGTSESIQDKVGADTLAVDQPYANLTTVVGYPSDTNQPITCTNYTTEFSSTQLQWDCGGYPGGTSGSPFLTDVNSKTGLGTVVGVIGGYETGGDTPDVSYSAYFTDSVSQLLAQAEAAG